MYNLVFGIITVLTASLLFFRAYKCYSLGKFEWAIFYIVLGGLILRVFSGFDMYLNPWDERFHALVAKNFLKHPFIPTLYDNPLLPNNPENWCGNHMWVHKLPLPLWFISGSIGIFGVNEIAVRLPSIVLSTIGIYLTYYIFKYLYGKREALLAAFFYSISGFIIEITVARVPTDHVDLFFLFFTELSIFFVILYLKTGKRYIHILIGLGIGCAILCKWLPALIVVPIWFILVWKKDTIKDIVINLFIILFFTLIVFLPWQIYIYSAFPKETIFENQQYFNRFFKVLDGRGGNLFYYLENVQRNVNVFVYISIIWFIFITIKRKKEEKYWAVVVWFLLPYIFFSILATKMQGYVLFVVPALFIMISHFFWEMVDKINKIKYSLLLKLLLAGILIYPVYYSVNRINPFRIIDRSPSWVSDLKKLNERIPEKNTVIFNVEHNIEGMFYTDFIMYKQLPSLQDIKDIRGKGYNIYLYDSGNLPDSLLIIPEVKILK